MISLNVWNLLFHVINILVLCVLMRKFLLRPVLNIIETRKNLIEGQLSEAEKAREEALALRAEQEQSIEEAKDTARVIVEDAREKGKSEYSRILSEAKNEAESTVKKADYEGRLIKEKAVRQAEQEIAGLAVAAAARILKDADSQAAKASLYDEFLSRAGDGNVAQNN